jgi:hypothetical protein
VLLTNSYGLNNNANNCQCQLFSSGEARLKSCQMNNMPHCLDIQIIIYTALIILNFKIIMKSRHKSWCIMKLTDQKYVY